MKAQHPPKKLTLIKETIAHLNLEQMKLAFGGEEDTKIPTTDTGIYSKECKNTPSLDTCLTQACLQNPLP